MKDLFFYLPAHSVKLYGPLGNALQLTLENRLKKVDYSHLVDPFRLRNERDGLWRCEFWGKITCSAIRAWQATHDEELLSIIKNTVCDLLSTQTDDGCISSYPAEKQTTQWDIWGRKYVLLTLIRYYNEVEQSEKVKSAVVRMLDHIMKQLPTNKEKLMTLGEHQGLPICSILGAVIGVYHLSGDSRHLDYARWIVSLGFCLKHDIVEAAIAEIPPAEIANGKAYELTSCFQGLAELYRIDAVKEWERAVTTYWDLVKQHEIFVTGIGGLKDMGGEYWFYGAMRQTLNEPGVRLGETCITTEWLCYSDNILRLTGDPAIAEAMEKTFYNGMLGAIKPDGSGWTHGNPTPLAGACFKFAADDQIAGFGQDCCLAHGPESVGLAPQYAVMGSSDGVVVNIYEDMDVDFSTPLKNKGKLEIRGGYPFGEAVKIAVQLEQREDLTLRLRIPSWWNEKCTLQLNGKACDVVPGKYCVLNRECKNGDCLELHFDLSVRTVRSPDLSRVSLQSGPIVLAQDSRFSKEGEVDLPIPVDTVAKRAADRPGFNAVWELPDGVSVCDYASAGNLFACDNRLCVWFREEEK